MKVISLVCPQCGGKLDASEDMKHTVCPYCNTNIVIDDEVQHVRFDNSHEAGYDFERGRMKAQRDQAMRESQLRQEAERKRKNRKWVILAWIFFFPIMLTYYIIKKTKMHPLYKAAILLLVWGLFIALMMYSDSSDTNNTDTATPVCITYNYFSNFTE